MKSRFIVIHIIPLILILILTLILGFFLYHFLNIPENSESLKYYFDMRSFKLNLSNTLGFFHYDGYFCVVTANRTAKEITSTTIHELTHYYINEDYKHFCEVK